VYCRHILQLEGGDGYLGYQRCSDTCHAALIHLHGAEVKSLLFTSSEDVRLNRLQEFCHIREVEWKEKDEGDLVWFKSLIFILVSLCCGSARKELVDTAT